MVIGRRAIVIALIVVGGRLRDEIMLILAV